jgi:hypothetical protein
MVDGDRDRRDVRHMAVWDPGDRGATRGGTAVDRYVRELVRDAERMRRSSRQRGRSDAVDAADRSPVEPPPCPTPEWATDDPPPVA